MKQRSEEPRSGTRRTTDSAVRLRSLLRRLDGASYGRYRQLLGRHVIGEFSLIVDRVPPDPFAGSARIRLVVSGQAAGLEASLVDNRLKRIAVEDWLSRRAAAVMERMQGSSRGGGPGPSTVRIQELGAAVIERAACRIDVDSIELRLLVDLPAAGRRIRGRAAGELFFTTLPRLATACLALSRRALEQAEQSVRNVEDHHAVQQQLSRRGLVAFLADGSLLARASGAGGDEDAPRRDGREVPLQAPASLAVTLDLPHAGAVRGLGIPAGVTLIVGGAFHGKSTLLDAIARGVFPHRIGDGRERVATIHEAATVRAEDGRAVRAVDISAFLGELPSGAVSDCFSTEKASGSTSQAASVIEAVEAGARLLLLDEDRCATNFMVRDGRMQRLVARCDEPITPFLDRVRELYERHGVSTVLVTGGSGDYLEVADTVIQMRAYRALDVTRRAREVASGTHSMRLREPTPPMQAPRRREPRLTSRRKGGRPMRFGTRGPRAIRAGEATVELFALEQLVEVGQVRALARQLERVMHWMEPGRSLVELIRRMEQRLDAAGLDELDRPVAYDLSRPRWLELAATLNRWRALEFIQHGDERS